MADDPNDIDKFHKDLYRNAANYNADMASDAAEYTAQHYDDILPTVERLSAKLRGQFVDTSED